MTYQASVSQALTEMVIQVGTLPSWNPHVPLNAVLATIEDINGPAVLPGPGGVPTGGALASGWQYPTDYATIASDPCNANVGAGAWDGVRRSFNPPGLVNGKPTFVEIDGVAVGDQVHEDFRTCYNPINFPGNLCQGSGGPSGRAFPINPFADQQPSASAFGDMTVTISNPAFWSGGNEPAPGIHRMHCEIDADWTAYSADTNDPTWDAWHGHNTLFQLAFGTIIDLQGWVFWDPAHCSEAFHNFGGWEIHPISAWRIHQ